MNCADLENKSYLVWAMRTWAYYMHQSSRWGWVARKNDEVSRGQMRTNWDQWRSLKCGHACVLGGRIDKELKGMLLYLEEVPLYASDSDFVFTLDPFREICFVTLPVVRYMPASYQLRQPILCRTPSAPSMSFPNAECQTSLPCSEIKEDTIPSRCHSPSASSSLGFPQLSNFHHHALSSAAAP